MNELTPIISNAAVTILTALIALVAAYALRGINALTAKIRIESAGLEDGQVRGFIDEALARLDDLAAKTVTQLEQTTAKALREAVKAGTANADDLKALGRRAVQEIIRNLSPDYRDAIGETVGDLEGYVTNMVETKVFELKNGVLSLPFETISVTG